MLKELNIFSLVLFFSYKYVFIYGKPERNVNDIGDMEVISRYEIAPITQKSNTLTA